MIYGDFLNGEFRLLRPVFSATERIEAGTIVTCPIHYQHADGSESVDVLDTKTGTRIRRVSITKIERVPSNSQARFQTDPKWAAKLDGGWA